MRWIHGHIKGKPGRAPSARTALDPLRHRALAALIVEFPLEHRLARLEVGNRGCFERPHPLRLCGVHGFLFPPFVRSEQVPIGGVGPPVQTIERDQLHIVHAARRVRLAADTIGAEANWSAADALEPRRHRPLGGDQHRDLDRASAFNLRSQVSGEHQRPPHDGGPPRIVRQWLETE